MISNNVDMVLSTFEVMTPDFETFKDGEEFLIVSIVISFGFSECSGMECDGVNVTIGHD